ncbi:MAG TPA: hypothetical protein VFI11_03900 [Anaerolineales bacterium]|nr:hypothetical protein [Anaerolineales bacterium]
MAKTDRMAAFEEAFEDFVEAFRQIPEVRLGAAMESTSPRQLAAQLSVWNRLCHEACLALKANQGPAHYGEADPAASEAFRDAVRRLEALEVSRLAEEVTASKEDLARLLTSLEAEEWTADRGIRHPEGGPASIRREVETLSRRYLDATDEILLWLHPPPRR